MDDDLDNIIDFLNNKDFQASIQQSQVQDLQSSTIEGQQKCNDKQISQTNAKTQSFLGNHLQQQQQPQLIMSEAAYNLSSNSNFTLLTQQTSNNNQQNSSQLPLSTTALQNQVHPLNYQSHNINQNTSAAKTNQPTLNQNVQAKVLSSGTGISGSFKLNNVQQKDLLDKKHHALTNSNSLVYQQPLHSVTNKNQSLVSSNYSQNNNSLSNASGNGGSTKQSEFIIRKTQNKRVMSQIRHNTNNEGHGMKLPPKQSKHNIMSNSGKKSKKMSSGKKSFIQELQINQQQSSDNNDYSDQQLIYSNRPALQNINKNLLQDDQYRNQKKFILTTQGSTDNYQQFQNQRDSIESSSIQQQQQQLLFKQMINYSSNTEIVNQENLIVIDNQQNYDDNPQGAPDQSDKQVQEEQQQQQQISSLIKKKFLVFRPYEDPITLRPYQAPDRGYYFKLHKCDVKIVRYTLEDNGFRETPSQEAKDWTILWSCSALKPIIYQQLLKYQKVNHFPSSFYITRKDLMYKSVSKMREIHGQKHFNFIPKTFLLPNEFVYLEDEMKKDPSKLWIAKPAASSQGKGIIVTNKILEIPQKGTPHIVSEYINNPLLFDGFKFDLRVYVAITSINPLRLYVYEDGLTRFATSKYTNELSGNKKQSKYTHLTNYSLNKFNPNFVANNDANADGVGSKWSLIALKKAFRDQGIDDQLIFKKIEDVIIKTILSAENVIYNAVSSQVPYPRTNCFELLGFDILIDNSLNPWLLEVNLSPSLNCDSPLDQKIKGNLIADLLTLSGIVPLDQRKATGGVEQIYGTAKGVFYGMYGQKSVQNQDHNQSNYGQFRRDSGTASSGKRQASKPLGTLLTKQPFGDVNFGATVMGGTLGSYGVIKQAPLSAKLEKQLVKEAEMEFKRRGKFKRVFPSIEYHYYKQFFTEERQLNYVLDQKLMSKRRLSNANTTQFIGQFGNSQGGVINNVIQMKQKIEYLNNKTNLIALANQLAPQQVLQSLPQSKETQQRVQTTTTTNTENKQQSSNKKNLNEDIQQLI